MAYEEAQWEMDVEANSPRDAVALSQSPDHEWIFCDSTIVDVGLPIIEDFYQGEDNWEVFEVLPDGTEKPVEEDILSDR